MVHGKLVVDADAVIGLVSLTKIRAQFSRCNVETITITAVEGCGSRILMRTWLGF